MGATKPGHSSPARFLSLPAADTHHPCSSYAPARVSYVREEELLSEITGDQRLASKRWRWDGRMAIQSPINDILIEHRLRGPMCVSALRLHANHVTTHAVPNVLHASSKQCRLNDDAHWRAIALAVSDKHDGLRPGEFNWRIWPLLDARACRWEFGSALPWVTWLRSHFGAGLW